MQQIADWLEKLGMSEYAGRFAENRIDVSVLPDLTDQDLRDLGVVLGDRRKFCAQSPLSNPLRVLLRNLPLALRLRIRGRLREPDAGASICAGNRTFPAESEPS